MKESDNKRLTETCPTHEQLHLITALMQIFIAARYVAAVWVYDDDNLGIFLGRGHVNLMGAVSLEGFPDPFEDNENWNGAVNDIASDMLDQINEKMAEVAQGTALKLVDEDGNVIERNRDESTGNSG